MTELTECLYIWWPPPFFLIDAKLPNEVQGLEGTLKVTGLVVNSLQLGSVAFYVDHGSSIFFFFFLAAPHDLQDLSSLTTGQGLNPGSLQ